MEDWSALGVSDGEGMRVARPRRGAPGYSHWGRAPAGEVRVRARVRVSGEGEGVSGEGEGEGERGVSVRGVRVRVGLVQLSRHKDTCMVHVGSWLRGSGALAAGWLLRCMGGVWVTPEATALTNATVASVRVSVWRIRSGATDFWRALMRIFCGWGGARWPDSWVLPGRRRACGAR